MSGNKIYKVDEVIIYAGKGKVIFSSNPIIECSIFESDEFDEAFIIKSKFDELKLKNKKLKDELERVKHENYLKLKTLVEMKNQMQLLDEENRRLKA